ncbi:MAG: penicillin-insensitive murein endopeptidase, partial [Deltaproteobacteria bacterium]
MRALATALLASMLPAACAHPALIDQGSGVSYGAPHAGYISRPHRLASRGRGYEVLRTRAEGGQHYGTARLVSLIERAAFEVQRASPRGAPLHVGDLSGPVGGQIPHHRSHRAGRDADLLFYALDEQGRPVPAPTFV